MDERLTRSTIKSLKSRKARCSNICKLEDDQMYGIDGATACYEATLGGGKLDDITSTSIHDSVEDFRAMRVYNDRFTFASVTSTKRRCLTRMASLCVLVLRHGKARGESHALLRHSSQRRGYGSPHTRGFAHHHRYVPHKRNRNCCLLCHPIRQ